MVWALKTIKHLICNTVCAMTSRDIVSELLLNTFASHFASTGPFWNLPCCAFALPFLANCNHDLCGEATIFLAAKWTVWGHGWLICQSCNNDFLSHIFVKPYTWESESSPSLRYRIHNQDPSSHWIIRDLWWASFRVELRWSATNGSTETCYTYIQSPSVHIRVYVM